MIFHFIIPSLPILRKNEQWSLTFPGIDFAFNESGRYFLCLLYVLPNEGRVAAAAAAAGLLSRFSRVQLCATP